MMLSHLRTERVIAGKKIEISHRIIKQRTFSGSGADLVAVVHLALLPQDTVVIQLAQEVAGAGRLLPGLPQVQQQRLVVDLLSLRLREHRAEASAGANEPLHLTPQADAGSPQLKHAAVDDPGGARNNRRVVHRLSAPEVGDDSQVGARQDTDKGRNTKAWTV